MSDPKGLAHIGGIDVQTPARSSHGERRRRIWNLKRWLIALPLAATLLAEPPTVHAEDLSQIAFKYQAPTGPGSIFALGYQIPPQLQTAVLITNGVAENPNSSTPDPEFAGAILLPLPADSVGNTGFEGSVPDFITAQEIADSKLHLWIVIYDPLTDQAWLSDPIPVQGLPSDTSTPPIQLDVSGLGTETFVEVGSTDVTEDSSSAEEDGVETDDDSDEDGEGEIWASTSDDGSDGGSTPAPHKPFNVGVPSIPWISDVVNILNLRNISGTSLLASIHDQSTPVQGSGH